MSKYTIKNVFIQFVNNFNKRIIVNIYKIRALKRAQDYLTYNIEYGRNNWN